MWPDTGRETIRTTENTCSVAMTTNFSVSIIPTFSSEIKCFLTSRCVRGEGRDFKGRICFYRSSLCRSYCFLFKITVAFIMLWFMNCFYLFLKVLYTSWHFHESATISSWDLMTSNESLHLLGRHWNRLKLGRGGHVIGAWQTSKGYSGVEKSQRWAQQTWFRWGLFRCCTSW